MATSRDHVETPQPLSPTEVSSQQEISFVPISSGGGHGVASEDHGNKTNEPSGSAQKKKRQRSSNKRRNRRQSFANIDNGALVEGSNAQETPAYGSNKDAQQFYKLGNRSKQSSSSLDSEALLDHRGQENVRNRKSSIQQRVSRPSGLKIRASVSQSGRSSHVPKSAGVSYGSSRKGKVFHELDQEAIEDDSPVDEHRPLMAGQGSTPSAGGYGGLSKSATDKSPYSPRHRRDSASSSRSKRQQGNIARQLSTFSFPDYDVNNPPSVPVSPALDPITDYEEVTVPEFGHPGLSPNNKRGDSGVSGGHETIIDVDEPNDFNNYNQSGMSTTSPTEYHHGGSSFRRRATIPMTAEEDVCLPFSDRLTDLGEEEEDYISQQPTLEESEETFKQPRSRRRPWPDLSALEDWSAVEKEERTMEGIRAKKVNEPVLVEGRLRPTKMPWRHEDEEEPFRWTYFNEELDSSLRSHTISGLQQLGHSFRELFIPDRPVIEDSDSESEQDDAYSGYAVASAPPERSFTPVNDPARGGTRQPSLLEQQHRNQLERKISINSQTPTQPETPQQQMSTKPKRYGPRPVFWLDVLQPTYEEMRVISRAFGIHKLTAEDIMEQEAREKVELFRNYYFVNYRTFEQDDKDENFLQPVNMYFVVFRGGIISFHFSQMPHPANVRRRIRQLTEHQYTDSDWISYAIIDNITDAYAPLIEQIEKEVDDIDEQILRLNAPPESPPEEKYVKKWLKPTEVKTRIKNVFYEKLQQNDQQDQPQQYNAEVGRDMLLRVGECRKRVMGLYRLLGNKIDVIKGLAKRYNEQKQLVLRTDVGLYLGDIQDHIVTMTGNLTHYESILARAHSNYLAQINIRMNERAEKTADVLGKLTVLGTIVLPMNIITGMWGMNVRVPGEGIDSLWWFWGITFGLVLFGISCFFTARKVYRIV